MSIFDDDVNEAIAHHPRNCEYGAECCAQHLIIAALDAERRARFADAFVSLGIAADYVDQTMCLAGISEQHARESTAERMGFGIAEASDV